MQRSEKIHIAGAVYCAAMIGMNRYDIVHYSRISGLTQSGFAPFIIADALAWMASVGLGIGCIVSIWSILSRGLRLIPGEWIPCRIVFLYTLPLLFVNQATSSWVEPDGAYATRSSGSGFVGSPLFFLTVLSLILFQVFIHLRADSDGPNQHLSTTEQAKSGDGEASGQR